MKKTILLLLAFALCIFIIPSCKKKKGCTDPASINYDSQAEEDDGSCLYKKKGCTDPISINYDPEAEEDDGSCIYAGIGGNNAINAYPLHHGVPITNQPGHVDSVFVKFNTLSFPGINISDYDLVVAGVVGEDYVQIAGLKPGKYYLYATGFDTTILQRVVGGIPYTITQTSGLIPLNIPVTE